MQTGQTEQTEENMEMTDTQMPNANGVFERMTTKLLQSSGTLLVLVLIAFATGIFIGGHKQSNAEVIYSFWGDVKEVQPEGVDFTAFYKAWNLLKEKYVPATTTDQISDEMLVYGAIEGLAKSYGDPYTTFFPPKESQLFSEQIQGSFGGVGMEIGVQDDVLTVIAPLKDSPAEKAGLRAGDRIVAIDGISTQGIRVDEGVIKIRGEIGTEVVLSIVRAGVSEVFDIKVIRDTINIPTLKTYMRDDGIFEVSLYTFSANSHELFRGAVREFIQSGRSKLILDLRGNPGGYLDAAVDMASWFLPVGEVVVEESFGGDAVSVMHRSKGYNVFGEDFKMVILVDQGSASASEILAGALKEHGVATLVGMKTYGKGSVQELVGVTDTTAIKITVARWLTPLGHSLSGVGLTPDFEVPVTEESIAQKRDIQKERAVKYLLQGF